MTSDDDKKEPKSEVNKRKPDISRYKSAVNKMGNDSTHKTAEMIELQAEIERATKLKAENIDYMRQVTEGEQEYDKDRLTKVFETDKKLAARKESYEGKYSTAVQKRELVAKTRFVSGVRHASQDGIDSISSIEEARALIAAQQGIDSGKYTESSIAKGLKRLPAQAKKRQEQVNLAAESGNIDTVLSEAEGLEETKSKYATVKVAQKEIKRKGLDSASLVKNSNEISSRINEERESRDLANKVSRGETGSMEAESSKLKEAEDRFLEAQQKFTEALSDGTPDIEGFKKAVIDSTKSLEEQKKKVSEMERQGKGGEKSLLKEVAKYLPMAGQALTAGANIYSNATVGAENTQMNLRAGFAGIQNQQFMDHYSAGQGDMASYFQVQDSTYGRSTKYGEENASQAKAGLQVSTGGSILTTAGEMAKSFAGGMQALPGTAGLAVGGTAAVGSLINGVESAAAKGVDLHKGLTEGSTALQSYSNRYNLSAATNVVRAAAGQQFLDTSMGNFSASQGFGGQRSDVFSNMQNNMGKMASYGMTGQDTQQLYGTAVKSMGDIFTKKGSAGMQSAIETAADVEVKGTTSAQDYISRIGQIGQAGGGDRQIADILANAVTRGVDNAKSFGDMVDAITSMSGEGASRGTDITGAVTKSTLAMMDSAQNNGMSDKMNINAVMRQQQAVKGLTSDTQLNFGTAMEQAAFTSGKLGDISQLGRAGLASMDLNETRSLKQALKGDKNKLKTMAERGPAGTLELIYDSSGNIRKDASERLSELEDAKVDKMVNPLRSFQGKNVDVSNIRKGLKSGKFDSLTTEEKTAIQSVNLGRETFAMTSDKGFGKGVQDGPTGEAAGALKVKQAQAGGQANMFEAGKEFTKGLETLGANMLKLSSSLDAGAAATKANNAAADMKLDASGFEGGVANFNKAVDKLLLAIGEKPSGPGFDSRNRIPQTNTDSKTGK